MSDERLYRIKTKDGAHVNEIGNCETPIQGTENGGNCLKN